MSNRGGNGGFSHSGVQPNHNSQRTFGANRPQTMNHQTRHIMQPNSANISQAVSNAGIPFHHQYMSHSQPGLMHHQMPPQVFNWNYWFLNPCAFINLNFYIFIRCHRGTLRLTNINKYLFST